MWEFQPVQSSEWPSDWSGLPYGSRMANWNRPFPCIGNTCATIGRVHRLALRACLSVTVSFTLDHDKSFSTCVALRSNVNGSRSRRRRPWCPNSMSHRNMHRLAQTPRVQPCSDHPLPTPPTVSPPPLPPLLTNRARPPPPPAPHPPPPPIGPRGIKRRCRFRYRRNHHTRRPRRSPHVPPPPSINSTDQPSRPCVAPPHAADE